jgi:hypothetical protein
MDALRMKDVELVSQEITADNMLSGKTDVEVELTTLNWDPLVSGITSHGSANGLELAAQTLHSCVCTTWIILLSTSRRQPMRLLAQ